MSNSILSVKFPVESTAYQAFSELKKAPVSDDYVLSQAVIVKREGGIIQIKDSADFGTETSDDTRTGGLIGSLIGVLGGPIGMLFYGSIGALVGSTIDSVDAADNASILERVAQNIGEGETSLLIMIYEDKEDIVATKFLMNNAYIDYYDAAEVEAEIEEAAEIQKQMKKEARKKLRQEKSDEQKAKIAKRREEFKAKVEARKEKYKKQSDKDGV